MKKIIRSGKIGIIFLSVLLMILGFQIGVSADEVEGYDVIDTERYPEPDVVDESMGLMSTSTVVTFSLKEDGEYYIAENFRVREFACKDGSDEILIDTELVDLLQNIRNHFGKAVTITSAYRTVTHNANVGGTSSSYHIKGMAADIQVSGVTAAEVAKYAETIGARGVGRYSNFVHVDTRPNKYYWTNSNGSTNVTASTHGGSYNSKPYSKSTRAYYVQYNRKLYGSGTMATSAHIYGVAKNLTPNGFAVNGYTFLGWSTNSSATNVNYTNGQSVKNLTTTNASTVNLYAVWKPNEYTIRYSGNGATGGSTESTVAEYNTTYSLRENGFTKTGYTFLGWSKDASATTADYSAGSCPGNLTSVNGATVNLYAVWQINSYYVDLNGMLDGEYAYNIYGYGTVDVYIDGNLVGDDVSDYSTNHIYGTKYEIKDIKAIPGHTYYGVATGSISGTVGTSAIDIQLKFDSNTYTVQYQGNGATEGITSSYVHTYGREQALAENSFTRDGFKFVGWNTKADGTGVSYSNCETVINLTSEANGEIVLYAQWESIIVYVEKVTLDKGEIILVKGETESIAATVEPSDATDKTIVWTSSDNDVAIVENGVVTAVTAGEAIITATIGGKSETCVVTVTEPLTEFAKAKINVGNVTNRAGETITLPISIGENPGIAGFKVKINFDNTVLEPVSIEKGSALTSGTLTSNIQQGGDLSSLTYVSAFWSNPANVTDNGEMLLVTFKVKDGVGNGTYPITVSYEAGDVTNQDFKDIGLEIVNGSIEVISVIMGDVFSDGKVNTKDSVKLSQYLADWDVELTSSEEAAADVFSDNRINTKDSVKLSQYLADWDIELISLLGAGRITFEAGSTEIVEGYVDIPVSITENSGVAGFKVKLNYDNALLTPVSVTMGEALNTGTMTSNIDQGGNLSSLKTVSVFWSNPANVTDIGIAFEIRFKVADGIADDIPVILSYEDGDICDQSFNDLTVTLKDGKVLKKKEYEYTVNSLEDVVIDSNFYAEVEITKNTDRDAIDTIVIAVYKDDILVDRIYMRSKFAKGQTAIFGGYLTGVEGATLKTFVWDDMTNMNTLSNVIER